MICLLIYVQILTCILMMRQQDILSFHYINFYTNILICINQSFCVFLSADCFCGLVVRVPGYKSGMTNGVQNC
jgi:hypothetical protein